MIIEDTTAYAYKLKRADNLTFDEVRAIAKKFIDDLPQDDVNELYDELNHGIDQLTTEPQMLTYLYSFGNMHQAKLNRAFDHLPDAFLQQPEIRIVDYGCGQAIGTMCYADFLADRDLSQTIKTVTLIEPSEICLKRAALHVSQFFPNAEIRTICKTFDDLTADDLATTADIPTLHIFSNVLDIQAFNLENFANHINKTIKGYNLFVCVGPYFGYSDKDNRISHFLHLFDGNNLYNRCFDKGEFNKLKKWTAHILCFEVDKMLIVNVENKNGKKEKCYKDRFGVIYSFDGKRLLICENKRIKRCHIKKGTEFICDKAFQGCYYLSYIRIPYSVEKIGKEAFSRYWNLETIDIPSGFVVKFKSILPENLWSCLDTYIDEDGVKDEFGVIYSRDGKRLLSCENNLSEYEIKDGTEVIGNRAFGRFSLFFNNLQSVRIPNSVRSIENNVFDECISLQQIIIPEESAEKFKKMLPEKLWDKLTEQ